MRRPLLLLAALVVPVLSLLTAAPAYAVDNVICVGTPSGTCNETVATISLAITAAGADGVDSTILVGPGTYTDGPYTLNGVGSALTLKGSGQGSTILTLTAPSASQVYLTANHASVQDLTVAMVGADPGADRGLMLYNSAAADRVTVDGTGTLNAAGVDADNSTVTAVVVNMPLTDPDSRGFYTDGGATVTDSTITAARAFTQSGTTTDTLSRVTIRARSHGITLDSGTVNIDNSVIDLGSFTGTAVQAANFNNSSTPKTVNADHLTIVGGAGASRGVWAYAAAPGALQTTTVNLTNSIVRGPATSVQVDAGNNGAQGGPSTATVNVSYSDYKTVVGTIDGATGAGGVVLGAGNVTDVDPVFVDAMAGDYRLAASSPLVDVGDPAAGGPPLDLDGLSRVVDGNGDGAARRDMGAYERRAPALPTDSTAPGTTITKKPAKKVTSKKVKFRFVSDEAGVTFQCKRDAKAYRPCTSPLRWKVKLGKHVLLVRAVDAAGNVDATPARYRFKRLPKPV